MSRKKIGLMALWLAALPAADALATDWTYTSQGSLATELTGGYGAVANPSTGSVYNDGEGDYSYAVILDSGSSGFLMSETVTDEFDVPLQPGVTYTETGIGGEEVENVTEPLGAYYAPISDSDPDDTATMTEYGTYSFESRQNDPYEGLIYFDIIGTPIIQNEVMVVTPSQTKNLYQSTLGALTAETTLQSSDPVLPNKGLYHIPVTWTNFVSGNPVPSEGDNPVIEGVTARGPSNTDVANNWLFDSGAQFTIISPTYAQQLGINLSDPTTTITGEGVGGSTVTFDGFQITDIALPLSNGDRLVIDDPTVYVPTGTTLPAGLTGILGENLWMQSTNKINQLTGKPKGTFAPLFSEWYLDGPGSQLVLYDPNSSYDAPGAVATWNGGGADNHWSDANNWGGTAPVSNAVLVFDGTTQLNASNDTAVNTQYAGITFNPGAGAFTLAGNGIELSGDVINNSPNLQTMNLNINLQASINLNAAAGDLAVNGAISGSYGITKTGTHTATLSGANTYAGATTVSGGTLVIAAPGALPSSSNVSIGASSEMKLETGIGRVTLSSLAITGGGQLDLTNNAIIINYTAGMDPIASIAAWINSGFDDGAWNGAGIISSSATANSLSYGIGYADSADPGNPAGLNGNQIEIMYTLLGDANLDGKVNGADFALMAAHFNDAVTAGWDEGDFNYDGTVNGEDFLILADDFNENASQSAVNAADLQALDSFAAANGISLAAVPEPGALTMLSVGALGLLRRRSRKRPPARGRS